MAMRVLTNQEKEGLKNYADFREECKWAVLNKASYWKGLDGGTVPGNDHIKWAKMRTYSAQVNANPTLADPSLNNQLVDKFLIYIKNIACVDDQVAYNIDNVVAYLLTNSHFEAMADAYFDDVVATYLF